MITLYDLKLGEKGIVKKIHTSNRELKERLISFGVTRNSEVEVKHCNLHRQNIEIVVSNTCLALRQEEAKVIEIEKV